VDRILEKERREMAIELGKFGNPDALLELIELTDAQRLVSGGSPLRLSVSWPVW